MKRASIYSLHRAAKTRRAGFLEACFKTGRLSGDKLWLEWDDAAHAALRREFNPLPPPASTRSLKKPVLLPKPKGMGLGDLIASVATPIARALKMDCIDGQTLDLKPDSECAKRKAEANKIRIKLPFSA